MSPAHAIPGYGAYAPSPRRYTRRGNGQTVTRHVGKGWGSWYLAQFLGLMLVGEGRALCLATRAWAGRLGR